MTNSVVADAYVTLIHGTWSDGRWARQRHGVPASLRQALEHGRLKLDVNDHQWSGRNVHDEREAAARSIEVPDDDGIPWVLIGHSHGGSIAMRLAEITNRPVAGIITMNTPFLVTVPRDIGRRRRLWIRTLLVLLIPLIAVAVLLAFDAERRPAWVATAGVYTVAWLALFRWVIGIFRQMSEAQAERPRRANCPVLCLRGGDDEAISSLELLENLANIPELVLHVRPLRRLALLIVAALIVSPLALGDLPWLSEDTASGSLIVPSLHWLQLTGITLPFALWTVALALILLQVLGIAWGRLLRKAGFGVPITFGSTHGRLKVSDVPLNARSVRFEVVATDEARSHGWFSHGQIYQSKETWSAIERWLAEIVGTSVRPQVSATNAATTLPS